MAHTQIDGRPPLSSASQAAAYVPVAFLQGGSALSETVIPAGSVNVLPFAITIATVASAGDPAQLAYLKEVAKGICGASLGAGAQVAVGSTNGILIPLTASGAASVANYPLRYTVGIALKNAAAGDIFPVFIDPQQIV